VTKSLEGVAPSKLNPRLGRPQRLDGGVTGKGFETVEALEQAALGALGSASSKNCGASGPVWGVPDGSSICIVMPESVETLRIAEHRRGVSGGGVARIVLSRMVAPWPTEC